MNKNAFLILGVLVLFSLTFVSADKIVQTSSPNIGLTIEYQKYDYLKIGQDFQVNIHVFNSTTGVKIDNSSTNCSLHGFYANGTHAIAQDLIYDNDEGDFYLDIPGAFFTGGKASVLLECMDGEGGFVSLPLEVTLSGLPFHLEMLWAYIFIILFMSGCFFAFSYMKSKINFESLENKLYERYKNKNHMRLAFSIIYTNVLKNLYVFQYLIGFLIIISLKEVTFLFNLRAVYPIFVILMSLYAFGSIFVVASIFSNVQEWIMNWKEDIEKINWGEMLSPHGK